MGTQTKHANYPSHALTVVMLLSAVLPASAQPQRSLVLPVAPPTQTNATVIAAAEQQGQESRRSSTFVERSLWGLGTGVLAFLAVGAVYGGDKPSDAVATAAYVGGTVVGVVLATHPREGTHLFGTAVRAVAGAVLGIGFAFAACQLSYDSFDYPGDCSPGAAVAAGLFFLAAVPSGASLGHAIDAHHRRR